MYQSLRPREYKMAVAKIMDYEAETVSVDTGTPVETPVETVVEPQPEVVVETPVETTPEKVETPAEDNLVELPDGRKLPPKEASAVYKELYSDYTQKSQRLAKYEKGDDISNINKPIEKSEWDPQSWEEVIERSKQALREDMEREKQSEIEARQKSEEYVSSQLDEIKKENPKLDENQLFNHALKYNFQDLKVAYSNMKDMNESIRRASEMTAQNLQKRSAEPISGGSQGGEVFDGDVYDPSARNMSMVDYLRSIK